MTLMWPDAVLRPQNVAFDLAPRTLAGPSSVSGFTQVVASDAGIWKAKFGSVVINRRQHVLAFRAIDALLEGRMTPILVPLCRGYQPVPVGAVDAGLYSQVPHSDDAFFDDGSGYVSTVIEVTASADAAARAVSVPVDIGYAGEIEPGQHFSIGERLYRIRGITFASPTSATLSFRPPLREAVTAGDRLEFDNPVCRMRLASDDAMNLELQLRRFGSPSVEFIEDL
jgi:hypothetical protein